MAGPCACVGGCAPGILGHGIVVRKRGAGLASDVGRTFVAVAYTCDVAGAYLVVGASAAERASGVPGAERVVVEDLVRAVAAEVVVRRHQPAFELQRCHCSRLMTLLAEMSSGADEATVTEAEASQAVGGVAEVVSKRMESGSGGSSNCVFNKSHAGLAPNKTSSKVQTKAHAYAVCSNKNIKKSFLQHDARTKTRCYLTPAVLPL